MGNDVSEFLMKDEFEDPALTCPLLDRFPTKEELLSIIPAGQIRDAQGFFLANWERQYQLDTRWSLLCANQDKLNAQNPVSNKRYTISQWKDLFKRSGLELTCSPPRHRDAKLDFRQLMSFSSYELSDNFVLPEKIPRKCDHCKTLLDAPKFCICGEAYCNEKCRGLEKKSHKRQCDPVRDNNMTAMKLIVQWQRENGATVSSVPRDEVIISRATMRDNILSFGGMNVVMNVFNVYKNILDPSAVKDLRHLTYSEGPSSVHACYLYGKLCDDPKVRNAQKRHARQYLQRAADRGLGPAWVALGCLARDDGDYESARKCWLRALRICRIPEAAYNIGIIYGLGYNVQKDFPLAMDFYQEAIDSPLPHCGNGSIPNVIADPMIYGFYTANNEDQSVFVTQAKHNLSVVRKSGQCPANMIRFVVDPDAPGCIVEEIDALSLSDPGACASSNIGGALTLTRPALSDESHGEDAEDDALSNSGASRGALGGATGKGGSRKNRKRGGKKKNKKKW